MPGKMQTLERVSVGASSASQSQFARDFRQSFIWPKTLVTVKCVNYIILLLRYFLEKTLLHIDLTTFKTLPYVYMFIIMILLTALRSLLSYLGISDVGQ